MICVNGYGTTVSQMTRNKHTQSFVLQQVDIFPCMTYHGVVNMDNTMIANNGAGNANLSGAPVVSTF